MAEVSSALSRLLDYKRPILWFPLLTEPRNNLITVNFVIVLVYP